LALTLALKNFYVLGLGFEKNVLALALALKNFDFLGLGLGLEKKVLALALALYTKSLITRLL